MWQATFKWPLLNSGSSRVVILWCARIFWKFLNVSNRRKCKNWGSSIYKWNSISAFLIPFSCLSCWTSWQRISSSPTWVWRSSPSSRTSSTLSSLSEPSYPLLCWWLRSQCLCGASGYMIKTFCFTCLEKYFDIYLYHYNWTSISCLTKAKNNVTDTSKSAYQSLVTAELVFTSTCDYFPFQC